MPFVTFLNTKLIQINMDGQTTVSSIGSEHKIMLFILNLNK